MTSVRSGSGASSAATAVSIIAIATTIHAQQCPPTTIITGSKYVATSGSTVNVYNNIVQILGPEGSKKYEEMTARVQKKEDEIKQLNAQIEQLKAADNLRQTDIDSLSSTLMVREAQMKRYLNERMNFEDRVVKAQDRINAMADTLAKERAREALRRLDFQDVEHFIREGFLELFQFRIGSGATLSTSRSSAGSELVMGFRLVNGQYRGWDTRVLTFDFVQRPGARQMAYEAIFASAIVLNECKHPCKAGTWGLMLEDGAVNRNSEGRTLVRAIEVLPIFSFFPARDWVTRRLLLFGGGAVDYVANAANERNRPLFRAEFGGQMLQRIGPLQLGVATKSVANALTPAEDHGQEVYVNLVKQLSWRPSRRDQHMEVSLQVGAAYWSTPALEHGVDWLPTSRSTVFARMILAPSIWSTVPGTSTSEKGFSP